LKFDVGALLGGHYFSCVLDPEGGLPVGGKLPFGVAEEEVRFPDCGQSDQDDLEHVVVLFFFLGHFILSSSENYHQKDLLIHYIHLKRV